MMRIDYFKLSFEKCLIVMMVIMMTSFSCGRDDVKTSLKLASQNRCELEKVLSHYKKERDYEKLKAAEQHKSMFRLILRLYVCLTA